MNDQRKKSRLRVLEDEVDLSDEEIAEQMFEALKDKYSEFQNLRQSIQEALASESEADYDQLLDCASDLDHILQVIGQRELNSDAQLFVEKIGQALDSFEAGLKKECSFPTNGA